MKSLYLLLDLGSFAVPFLFSFHPKLRFDRHFKAYFAANIISASIFLIWDAIFTAQGVWGFSDRYTLGPRLAGMPFEEVMFFFCIPFACIFTFHCLRIFREITWSKRTAHIFFTLFSLLLILLGLYFHDRAYTSITFISTALLIMLFIFVFKVSWLGPFFSIYPILLIPFFIVNGILTGTGLDEPVVWYNNMENMGIRMGTIPAEDTIYGLELLILTLFFYEIFRKK